MNRILSLFEKKYVTIACILIAFICRIVNVLFVSYAGRDKMSLLLQSKNFLEGHGLGIPQHFANNLDVTVYDYTQLWPPGYSLFVAPFLKIFNYNIYWSTTTLDILVAIAFIIIVRIICRQIELPAAATNLMTLIAGCFEYPFISESLPTDSISFVFFLAGISLSLKVIENKSFPFLQIFIASLFLFFPCFFRYAYPPLSIAVSAVIILYAWAIKDKFLLRKGLWISAITLAFIAIFFILLKSFTGQTGYITPTERGYFPGNIIHWYPVVPGSFVDLPLLTSQALKITGTSLQKLFQILETINIPVLLFLTALFFYSLFIKKVFKKITPAKWMILWGFACSGLSFLTLGGLSFTYQMQKGFLNNWNYIYEGRYYAFVILFLQLLFLGWVFLSDSWKKSMWQKAIVAGCSLLLFIEVSHAIYFHTKVALNFKEYKSAVYREQDYNYFISLLSTLKKDNPVHEILVAAPGDNFYTYTSSYYGNKGIFDAASLTTTLPKVKTRSLLVLMLYDNELDTYRSLITLPGVRMIQRVAYSNFFLVELLP